MQKIFAIGVFSFLVSTSVWAAVQTVTLAVPDMNCPACPYTVKKALSKVNGVGKIEVSLEKHEAVVVYDDSKTNVAKLTEATESAGYPSSEKK
jgi:mercuric ion binding protein